jgi:hypothetical protein
MHVRGAIVRLLPEPHLWRTTMACLKRSGTWVSCSMYASQHTCWYMHALVFANVTHMVIETGECYRYCVGGSGECSVGGSGE